MILGSDRPYSAKDLHDMASEKGNIDLVTVYRVVSLLLENGLIREIKGDSGTAYYEKACEHNPVHPHFHCGECGKVYCLEPLTFEEGLILGRVGKNFRIRSVSLDIKGVCEKCVSL
jgi:Fe2+ or Zn2+ uptake regulation protein